MSSTLSVWATGNAPNRVCEDARVRDATLKPDGSREPKLPWEDQFAKGNVTWGQTGWHVGINFRDFDDLLRKLQTTEIPDWAEQIAGFTPGTFANLRHENRPSPYLPFSEGPGVPLFGHIQRLAINCHGFFGSFEINGSNSPLTPMSAVKPPMSTQIGQLCRATTSTATIYLMGCMAGGGGPGSELLRTLSRMMNPRTVVGFSKVGANGPQSRPGGTCDEPGMRDTNGYGSSSQEEHDKSQGQSWRDLTKWPWASEHSPHAKVAQGGSITRWPVDTEDDGQNPRGPTAQELLDQLKAMP